VRKQQAAPVQAAAKTVQLWVRSRSFCALAKENFGRFSLLVFAHLVPSEKTQPMVEYLVSRYHHSSAKHRRTARSCKITRMNLIQIVPGLLPKFDGIGDYAMQIARRLRESHGVHTSFIVGDPAWDGGEVEGFFATKVGARTCRGLLDALEQCERNAGKNSIPALLHFSPYGYQVRGYPLWLQRSLEKWQARTPDTLNVVFHELDVHCFRPWSSAFWVSALQRNLIRHVAKIGSLKYTNTEYHRSQLETMGSGRIKLIPNFSTLGEPSLLPPFSERQNNVIVFGRGDQRKATYARGSDVLSSLCRRLKVERIIDIGEPIVGGTTAQIDGVPIFRCGRLEVEEVNRWMSMSIASFIVYPVPLLSKSSVYAVSCAHGTIPFIFDNQKAELSCPGLVPDEDYVAVKHNSTDIVLPRLDLLSATVFNNYQARNSSAASGKIARHLFGTSISRSDAPRIGGILQQECSGQSTASTRK
jgi:hypothetical protein